MQINNFPLIDAFIEINNKLLTDDDFLFVQLYKRRKDHPTMSKDMELIDNFYVTKKNPLLGDLQHKIVTRCLQTGCRAYIRLNKRSFHRVALANAEQVIKLIRSNQAYAAKNSYISAVGSTPSDPDKTWVIDLDDLTTEQIADVAQTVHNLQSQTNRTPLLIPIPTVAGRHLITRPFSVKEFKETIPFRVDIHKDNPTLLYYYKDEN